MTTDTAALVPAARLVSALEYVDSANFGPEWPLRSYLELGALNTAPSCARSHVRLITTEWDMAALTEAAGLVITELTTNAVQASADLPGSSYQGVWSAGQPPIRLWITSDHRRILIQVWDASHLMPARQEPDSDAETGRGLQIVAAVSSRWGAFTPEGSGGKVVWALLDG